MPRLESILKKGGKVHLVRVELVRSAALLKRSNDVRTPQNATTATGMQHHEAREETAMDTEDEIEEDPRRDAPETHKWTILFHNDRRKDWHLWGMEDWDTSHVMSLDNTF